MTTVLVRSDTNFRQEIVTGNHVIVADEPVAIGGDDSGPNPYALLLGALGACTSITILMYARRKGWTVEHVEIELIHSRDYLKDCEDCADKPVRIDRITRRIRLTGDLSSSQRDRLAEIATKCPVHQTLTGQITIDDLPLEAG